MSSSTSELGLILYGSADYQTTFLDYWSTVNGIGEGTTQSPYSAFQKIDAAIKDLREHGTGGYQYTLTPSGNTTSAPLTLTLTGTDASEVTVSGILTTTYLPFSGTDNNSVILGKQISALGASQSVVIGAKAETLASSTYATVAIGYKAYAMGNSVVIGTNAKAGGMWSTVVGHSTNASSYATSATYSAAFGYCAYSAAQYGVALGAMAKADIEYTVSFDQPGIQNYHTICLYSLDNIFFRYETVKSGTSSQTFAAYTNGKTLKQMMSNPTTLQYDNHASTMTLYSQYAYVVRDNIDMTFSLNSVTDCSPEYKLRFINNGASAVTLTFNGVICIVTNDNTLTYTNATNSSLVINPGKQVSIFIFDYVAYVIDRDKPLFAKNYRHLVKVSTTYGSTTAYLTFEIINDSSTQLTVDDLDYMHYTCMSVGNIMDPNTGVRTGIMQVEIAYDRTLTGINSANDSFSFYVQTLEDQVFLM